MDLEVLLGDPRNGLGGTRQQTGSSSSRESSPALQNLHCAAKGTTSLPALVTCARLLRRVGDLRIKLEGRETCDGVTTYAIRVSGPQVYHVVRRRYKDFQQLHRDMPGLQQVVAMPEKSFWRNRFSEQFRINRERSLEEVVKAALTAAADVEIHKCPPALHRFLGFEDSQLLISPRMIPGPNSTSEPDDVHETSEPVDLGSPPLVPDPSDAQAGEKNTASVQSTVQTMQQIKRKSKEHVELPRTLSRHHSVAYSQRFSRNSESFRSSYPAAVRVPSRLSEALHRSNTSGSCSSRDLQVPLLQESHTWDAEQQMLEREQEEELLDQEQGTGKRATALALVGSWMDVSVTKNYAETFSISEGTDSLQLVEVGHNGQVHRAPLLCNSWGAYVAKSQARSIRTHIPDLSSDLSLIKFDFEFKTHDADAWTESKAGKVFADRKSKKVTLFSGHKVAAMLIVFCLALMDARFYVMVSPALRNRFYEGYDWNPVSTSTSNCLMPPPQPFYLEAGGAMVRTFATSAMLSIESVMSWADEYPRKGNLLDWVKVQGLRWYLNYQIASLPLSLCLVLYHWEKTSSDDIVCLAAMFVNSPYILNTLVNCAQWAIGRQYVRHMHAWSRGAKHRGERWRMGKGGFMNGKQKWLGVLAVMSAVLVGIPTIVVLFFYCLPGLSQPILCVQFLGILSMGATMSWLLGAVNFWQLATGETVKGELLKRKLFLSLRWEVLVMDDSYASQDNINEAMRVSDDLEEELAKQEEHARSGWTYAVFYFMPVFVSIRIALEVLFCESTYVHSGLSAWEATEVTWSERQIRIFVASLIMASQWMVWHLWSSSGLLLEWF